MAGKLPTHRKPTSAELQSAYSEGMQGWIWDKQAEADWCQFAADNAKFEARGMAIKGMGAKVDRVMLWRSRELYDPGAFGKEAQTTGDCTSHGDRNAKDVSRSVDIHIKGEPETYYRRGATEPTYGMRGHHSEGMAPYFAAKFATEYGWIGRDNYEGVVDLTKYDANIGIGWGRKGTPEAVKKLCAEMPVGSQTVPKTIDDVKDLLANGYAGHSGQNWGTSSKTGSDGVNRKTANWSHDMATVGYDFTKEIWKENVFFVPNSWGPWNKRNPKWNEEALGPWIEGMIMVSEEDYDRYFVRSGSIHFYSNVTGFPVQHLPEYGFGYV